MCPNGLRKNDIIFICNSHTESDEISLINYLFNYSKFSYIDASKRKLFSFPILHNNENTSLNFHRILEKRQKSPGHVSDKLSETICSE